jgi:predicted dehydrogenase
MKVGIIGCGRISEAYLKAASRFESVEIVAVADLLPEVAQARAQEFGCVALSPADLIKREDLGAIVNLTIPSAHVEIGLAALEAGKHVYSEKPIAIDLDASKALLKRADELGLRVGCAPDTVLGAGIQTSRHLIDSGAIGRPLSAIATMGARGPERFHPNPGFFYQKGAGPMFDMGPYYLTSLVHFFGPVRSVTGIATKGFAERICGNPKIRGKRIPVEVPTHYTGVMEFDHGVVVTLTVSFDIHAHGHAPIEVYGEDGSLAVPDPNFFGNEVRLFTPQRESWEPQPFSHSYADPSRIIGLVDMIESIECGRPARCSGELAHHILEVMLAFEQSSVEARRVRIESSPDRPAALPPNFRFKEKEMADMV